MAACVAALAIVAPVGAARHIGVAIELVVAALLGTWGIGHTHHGGRQLVGHAHGYAQRAVEVDGDGLVVDTLVALRHGDTEQRSLGTRCRCARERRDERHSAGCAVPGLALLALPMLFLVLFLLVPGVSGGTPLDARIQTEGRLDCRLQTQQCDDGDNDESFHVDIDNQSLNCKNDAKLQLRSSRSS